MIQQKKLNLKKEEQNKLFGASNSPAKTHPILVEEKTHQRSCNLSLLCDRSTVMTIQLGDVELEQLQSIKVCTFSQMFYIYNNLVASYFGWNFKKKFLSNIEMLK